MEALRIASGLAPPTHEATTKPARPKAEPQHRPSSSSHGPEPAPHEVRSANPLSAPGETTPSVETRDQAAEKEEIAERIEKELQGAGPYPMEVTYSAEDDRFIVTVLDPVSGDIVRQIPAAEVLAAQQRLNDLRGLLFDEQS